LDIDLSFLSSDAFEASKVQEQLFLAQQTIGDAPSFHVPFFWEIRGDVDAAALRGAIEIVVGRHEALRTTFRVAAEGLLQVVDANPVFDWIDGEYRTDSERQQWMRWAALQPFDLERGPLVRSGLLRSPSSPSVFMICCHHAIIDGWSAGVVVAEVAVAVRALSAGRLPDLPEVPFQYGDYALWHNEWLQSAAAEHQLTQWADILSGDLPTLRMSSGIQSSSNASVSGAGSTLSVVLPGWAVARLRTFARESRTTLFTVLLAAYDIVLSDCTGVRDVIIGTPAFNRTQSEFERTVGCFFNMVTIRTSLDDSLTFRDLVTRVQTSSLRAQDLQAVPFETVVQRVKPIRRPGVAPVFQVIFSAGESFLPEIQAEDLAFVPVEFESATAKYELALHVAYTADGAVAHFEYRAGLFSPAWADAFATRYLRVLELAAEDPGRTLGEFFVGAGEVADGGSVPGSDAPAAFAAPRSEVEQVLAEVWGEMLDHPGVGIDENFFELGGNSMRSVQIVAAAAARGVSFRVADLLRNQTIRELSPLVSTTIPEAGIMQTGPFDLVAADDRGLLPPDAVAAYPLAALQSGMLYLSGLTAAQTTMYNEVAWARMRVEFSADAWRSAVAALLERHEQLRMSFSLGSFIEPLQIVHERIEQPPVTFEDLRDVAPEQQHHLLDQRTLWEANHPFRWAKAPLIRYHVTRCSDTELQLWTVAHHAVIDGWSGRMLFGELLSLYLAALGRHNTVTEPPRSRYRSFIALERAATGDEDHVAFWQDQLAGAVSAALPGSVGSGVPDMRAVSRELPTELSEGAIALAARVQVSVRTIVLTAHLRVMGLLSGSDDVVSGAVFNGRIPETDGDRVAGLFLNTLPFRCRLQEPNWARLIRQVADTDIAIQQYRRFPMAELRNRFEAAAFETFFNYTHFHVEENIPTEHLEILDEGGVTPTAFLLGSEFSREHATGHLGLALRYDADRIADQDAERYFEYYVAVIRAMISAPDASLAGACILTPAEAAALNSWNETKREYPRTHLLHRAIEEQAVRTPDAVAVAFRNDALTYCELDRLANRLAHRLISLGVQRGDRVGVCQERSMELVVSLLAILKAGAAYLPIDPADPADRISSLITEAGCRTVLTTEDVAGQSLADFPDSAPDVASKQGNAAYVMYTSGSTGHPKAVVVPHQAICNRLWWMQEEFTLTVGDRVLQKTPYTFDVSVWEFFWPLMQGARLVVAEPGGHSDPAYLSRVMTQNQITVAHFVPSMLRAFVGARHAGFGPQLRLVVCSGEELPADLAQEFRHRSPAALANLYGPTEAAVDVTWWRCTPDDGTSVPIGRPIANTRIHILDPHGNTSPIGITGELFIGGTGLATGYHGRPDLTAERFPHHAWPDGTVERLYRTGDLARWRADGVLEYLGRTDSQVKIRGMRVELGEIEAVLSKYPGTRGVAVLYDGERLIAYFVPNADIGTLDDRRHHAQGLLPRHMVPSVWQPVPELPLTSSGKVDRRRLPAPAANAGPKDVVPPTTPTQNALAGVWSAVLGNDDLGIRGTFFEAGGHSLSAVRLIGLIQQEFGRQITVADLFSHDTIERLAEFLDERAKTPERCFATLLFSPAGAGIPLWLFPPVGGSALCYLPLVASLEPGFPIHGLEYTQPAHTSVEEMAAEAVRLVENEYPDGPVRLAGWSFGAVLAFETAAQLRAKGREPLLCMIDAAFPDPAAVHELDDERILCELFRDTSAITGIGPSDAQTGSDEWRLRRRIFETNLRAHHAYRPRPYSGDVAYAESADGQDMASAGAWRTVIDGTFRIQAFDTDHYGLVRLPHVHRLGIFLAGASDAEQ
jgi:amino acid adenylation domain-containing protein